MDILISNYEFTEAFSADGVPSVPGLYALFSRDKNDWEMIDLRASDNLALTVDRVSANLVDHMVAYLPCDSPSLREAILSAI